MIRLTCTWLLILFTTMYGMGQTDSTRSIYINAYDSLELMLNGSTNQSFKKAVFIAENTYTGNQMSFEKFDKHISSLVSIAKAWMKANPLMGYRYSDSVDFHKNFSILL